MIDDFNVLIKQMKDGVPKAQKILMELAYNVIKDISALERDKNLAGANTAYISNSRTDITHDVCISLMSGDKFKDVQSERDFYNLLTNTVRLHLVTQLNSQNAQKRNPYEKIPLQDDKLKDVAADAQDTMDMIVIDNGLKALESEFPEHSEVLQLKYFAQLSDKEIARLLSVSVRTVQNKTSFARARMKQLCGALV